MLRAGHFDTTSSIRIARGQSHSLSHYNCGLSELVSYQRLIECLPAVLVPLSAYLETRLGRTHDVAFVDSLPLPVCHHRRIHSHRAFAEFAQRGKGSRGWLYGFKLHFVINDEGDRPEEQALLTGAF